VRKVEMVLERDEFLVTYDASKADDNLLIETVKKSGYTTQVVADNGAKPEAEKITVLPQGFPVLDKAVARAKAENKPLVLDFHAEWCIPCRRMEKEVFPNPKVAEQLKRVVFLRIDTDKEPELSENLGVVGLPDIRFFSSDARFIDKSTGFITVESFSKKLDELTK
jgi:thiol:disulfide interchange protein